MTQQKPSVGRIVHYVSYDTPGGEFRSECRAAVVAGVPFPYDTDMYDNQPLDLVVLNPTGLFFNRCPHDPGDTGNGDPSAPVMRSYRGGTWHWPESMEE